MSQWSGKSKGTKLGYLIFVQLLKIGGLKSAYALLQFVKLYYIWFANDATRALSKLYMDKLGYTKKQTRKLIQQNIEIFGQTIIDRIATMSHIKTPLTVSRDGEQYLNEIAHNGKGGILVSAHLGNYEMAAQLLQRYESKVNIIMYDGEGQQLKEYLDKVSGEKSFNIIFIKDDMSHVYEMSAALARNELLCIHADRYLEGSRTISHTFLGEEAKFPLGPFALASKLKSPVCFVFALKQSKYHYHFLGYPPKIYEGRGLSGAELMLEDYVALLEENVKRSPEQWFNYYDFWAK